MSLNAIGRFLRPIGSWLVAAVILWFLLRRLLHDWPTVQPALNNLHWPWVGLAVAAGFFYFVFHVLAWRRVLASLGLRPGFWPTARVWMNGEIVRFIPGNVWSVWGRVAQAERLGASKSRLVFSMAVESMVMVSSAVMLSGLLLIEYPNYGFAGRTVLLLIVAVLALAIGSTSVGRKLIRLVVSMWQRKSEQPALGNTAGAFWAKTLAWLMFALFHLFILQSLGVPAVWSKVLLFSGIFIASWLVGYLSFITPSGLGVREAVVAWFFVPFLDLSQAVLVAVLSRVAFTVTEVLALGAVNVISRSDGKLT